MTHRGSSSEPDLLAPDANLFLLVTWCQKSYSEWQHASNQSQGLVFRAAFQRDAERLWEALADSLRKMALRWLSSGVTTDVESMAMNLFAHLMLELPHLKLDPQQNIRSYLLKVARNCSYDEYQKIYKKPAPRPHRAPASSADTPIPDADFALGGLGFETLANLADPASLTAEERLISTIDNDTYLKEIWAYWETLVPIDRQIMRLRWSVEPPASFRTVASQLGPGWTEDAVRQRHYRIFRDTRSHLQDKGLFGHAQVI